MSRQYPKFIYSKVTNAENNGEFIVATLKPRLIAKVLMNNGRAEMMLLEKFDSCNDEEMATQLQLMKKWYVHSIFPKQQEQKGMLLHDAYKELLSIRGISNTFDLNRSTVSNIKKQIEENDKYPSVETMRTHLALGGWHKVDDERWEKIN
jgi:ABC-type sulfate transport system substrate-binding protein